MKERKTLAAAVLTVLLLCLMVTACGKAKVYRVSFDYGGGTVKTQEVKEGGLAVEPVSPEAKDKVFTGWVTADGTLFDFNAAVAADVALKPSWKDAVTEKKRFTVTLIYGYDNKVETRQVDDGEKLAVSKPSYQGREFLNWYDGDEVFDIENEPITADILLTARWFDIEYTETQGTQTYLFDKTACAYTLFSSNIAVSLKGVFKVPEKINGYPVTAIAQGALAGQTALDGIIVPDTITSIGKDAFEDCEALTTLRIPCLGGAIGAPAADCTFEYYFGEGKAPYGLKELYIGDGVMTPGLLGGFGRLTDLTLPYIGTGLDLTDTADLYRGMVGNVFGTEEYEGSAAAEQYIDNKNTKTFYIPANLRKVTILKANLLRVENITPLPGEGEAPGDPVFRYVYGLGEGAFSRVSQIEKVVLPGDTEVLESSCFRFSGLVSIELPDTVESLGNYAFHLAEKLEEVKLSDNLRGIPSACFQGCAALKQITLPASVKELYESSFSGSGLVGITVPDTVTDLDHLNIFKDCAQLSSAELNAAAAKFGDRIFSGCVALKNIVIDSPVEELGIETFKDCASLESFTFPSSVKKMGHSTFSGCLSLTSVIFPSGAFAEEGAAYSNSAGGVKGMFKNCTALTAAALPASFTALPKSMFYGCSALTAVTVHEGIQSIEEGAFYSCASLKEIALPLSLTSIKANAFAKSGLVHVALAGPDVSLASVNAFPVTEYGTVVTVPDAAAADYKAADVWSDIAGNIAAQSQLGSGADCVVDGTRLVRYFGAAVDYILPAAVTQIGEKAFMKNSTMKKITLHGGVTAIGACAFQSCPRLEIVEFLGATPPEIDDERFDGSTTISKIKLAAFPIYFTYSSASSGGTNYITFVVPDNSLTLYKTALAKYAKFGGGSENEEEYRDYYTMCNIVGSGSVTDGKYIVGTSGELIRYLGRETDVVIPQKIGGVTVTSVGLRAFYCNVDVRKVTLPATVTKIGYKAFMGCLALEEIDLKGVTSLGTADEGGTTESKKDAGRNFSYTALDTISGIKVLAAYSFQYCRQLKSIDVTKTDVVSVPYQCFGKCTAATDFKYGDNVKTLEANCLNGCESITELTLGGGLTKIGGNAFSSMSGLEVIYINLGDKDNLFRWDEACVSGCTNVVKIVFKEDANVIFSKSNFTVFTKLTKLYLPKGVSITYDNSFTKNHTLLTDIYLSADENYVETATDTGGALLWSAGWIKADCKAAVHYGATRPEGF